MIMEPMAGATSENRDREERGKFRAGLKRGSGSLKRKRDDEDVRSGDEEQARAMDAPKKKKRIMKGPKEPNPLAVRKPKKKPAEEASSGPKEDKKAGTTESVDVNGTGESESNGKRKRKRKHKSATVET
jgi:U3 small nucleolar RNA-associated protein 23